MNKERIRKALELVLTDLQMLKSGEWSPDKGSVQASIDNVELIDSELELEWSRLASQKITGDPLKINGTLPNGATVHAFAEVKANAVGYHDKGIVLAINDRDEWVTWAYSVHSPASTVWGHYHGDNYKSALEDFKQRVADL